MSTEKTEQQQLSQIISPNGINIEQFTKACDDEEVDSLTQFIITVQKILKLYEKPGRTNPFASLPTTTISLVVQKLKKLEHKLKYTIYQLKIRNIIQRINLMKSQHSTNTVKEQEDQIKRSISNMKIQQIIANPQSLNNKFTHPRYLYQFLINQILAQVGRQILSINDHQKRYEQVLKGLQLCNLIIHPTQIQIQVSKNTLVEARVFKMKYQYQFQMSQHKFMKKGANIINQALLCPSDPKIQLLLLKILKRMYKLWGQPIHGPLYLNLRNISLFFSQQPAHVKLLKQAAIFCYSIIHSKLDIKFGDMLSSSQDLKDLKSNQFFSSKGLALPMQLGNSFNTINLQLPLWKYRLHLQKRQRCVYNVIVEKPNTMLYWSFQIIGYDIGFGIYKVNSLRKYTSEQYEKSHQIKAILKLAKYGNGTPNSKMPVKGHIFLKTGVYHILFDNTHSMVRGKQVHLQFTQFQSIS